MSHVLFKKIIVKAFFWRKASNAEAVSFNQEFGETFQDGIGFCLVDQELEKFRSSWFIHTNWCEDFVFCIIIR